MKVLVVWGMLTVSVASAQVSVNNPSFEKPPGALPNLCPGTNCSFSTSGVPGWNLTGAGGQFNPGNPSNTIYFNSIPDGVKVGYTFNGSLTQNVGQVASAGTLLTLRVDMGWRSDLPAFTGTAQLKIDGTTVTATGTAPTIGNFSTFTATYLTTPGDIGANIRIVLSSTSTVNQGIFDNVRLTAFDDEFKVHYAVNLANGDSIINITNTGSTDPSSGDADNICVNVYTYDVSEEIVSCCSCLLTPNALVSLSVQGDLISNTLSPSTPTAVVIKMVATDAGRSALASCNPGNITQGSLASGLRAWGTTLHAVPGTPVKYGLTESEFLDGGLSAAELNHLTSFCGFINANGSGFGVCKSCRAGGLGGAKN